MRVCEDVDGVGGGSKETLYAASLQQSERGLQQIAAAEGGRRRENLILIWLGDHKPLRGRARVCLPARSANPRFFSESGAGGLPRASGDLYQVLKVS